MDTPPVRELERSRHLQRKIAERLKQSIDLLDSSVGSSTGNSSILRTSKTLQTSRSFTPRYTKNAPFDVSSYIGSPHAGKFTSFNLTQNLDFSPSFMRNLGGSPHGKTIVKTPGGTYRGMCDDLDETVAEIIHETDPGAAATEPVFENFLDNMLLNSAKNDIFNLLDSNVEMCHYYASVLAALKRRLPVGQTKSRHSNQLLHFFTQEANTWELIRNLYGERLMTDGVAIEVDMLPLDVAGKKMSPKTFVEHLYEHDTNLRQCQLVVKWLEAIMAREVEEDSNANLEHFADKCIAWEYTLGLLQKNGPSSESNMVSEIDPDAPLRQGKPIADMDKEDYDNFLRCLFLYIRSGQLEKAERLCEKCGEFWRIAAMQGWRLYHDPNYDGLEPGGTPKPIEGNRFRDIWKATCFATSQMEAMSIYERALQGILCGNLQAVLLVCSTWEEHLWAYYRCMIDTKVEHEIRSNLMQPQGYKELPQQYWNQMVSCETIFQQLKSSTNENIQKESREPFHIIQKCVILDDIEGLIEELYEMTKAKHKPSPHLLRFCTHLVLFLRAIGLGSKEELCVAVLENYVKFLIEQRKISLVPSYTFNLPQMLQVSCYAEFLEEIEDSEERKICLQLAGDVGLDVPVITKMVVENIRARPDSHMTPLASSDLQAQTSDDDRKKINAIDWLVFDPDQRAEALRQANALMRTFLGCNKLSAVQAVFTKLPPDSIAVIHHVWKNKAGSDDLCASDDNAIREYLCFQAYLKSQDSFNDWYEHYHHGKPEAPQLAEGANFTDRIVHEHREKQYESDRERWQHSLDMQTMNTVGMFYNVLMFVDGGWMVDQREEDEDEGEQERQQPHRSHQMQRLRESCLPQIVFMLLSVLTATGQHRECLQLADVIASEHHQLYKVFRKAELRQFLQKIGDSSVSLMNSNLDPFGYPFK